MPAMNGMLRVIGLLALLGGRALAEELPATSACQTALKALAEAEDALLAANAAAPAGPDAQRRRAVEARLYPQRQRVADLCLGGLTTSPPPSQRSLVLPPLATRPDLRGSRPPGQPALPPLTVPLPRFEAPLTITHCNAAVCTASDGSTLTRVGPTLIGPRGACRAQGGVLSCP